MEAPLLILCGGHSRRMGSPKPLLPWRGKSLLARHIAAASPYRPVWLASDGICYPDTDAAVYLPDLLPAKQGALSAIAPALQRAYVNGLDGIYVFSCDTLLNPERVISLLDSTADRYARSEGVVMLANGERGLPLLARWSAVLAHDLANDVEAGQRRVHGWLAKRPTARVPLPAAEQLLANFNNPAEFAAACAAWQSLQAA